MQGQTSRVEAFVNRFQEQSLLRIHGQSFNRLHAEETGIESLHILLEEIRMPYVARSMVHVVRVVVAVNIESILADLSGNVERSLEELP